jgi:cation transport regulator
MPYKENSELPKGVKDNLPAHAQDIYREAFNHAWGQYKSPSKRRDPHESQEQVSHKIAWSAVEKKYKKDANGKWVKI